MWFRYSTSKCVCVGGSQSHQPRPMVGHSWRGSLAEPDLWMRALESKVSWIVGKNLSSPNKTLCRGKTCTFGPLKGHLSQVCSAACLHLSACLWVTSLKRYWFNPFLCQSSDLREHGGQTSAACTLIRGEYFIRVCWSRNNYLHSLCCSSTHSHWDSCRPLLAIVRHSGRC